MGFPTDLWGEIRTGSTDSEGLSRTALNLEQLAARVMAGTEKLTDAQKDLLKELKAELEKIITGLDNDHKEDQNELNNALQAIKDCDAGTNGIAEAATSSGDAGTTHSDCRASENTKKVATDTACELYVTTASSPGAPECMYTFPKQPKESEFDAMGVCVKKIYEWAKDWHVTLGTKKETCEETKDQHETQKEECDAAQKSYETSFCAYRQTLVTKCDDYASCRATKIAAFEVAVEGIKVDESARKAMFSAAKNVICYLGVFEAAAKDQPATLKACKDHGAYDSAHLNVNYPSLPAALACDKSPVSTYPCEPAWTAANYDSKPWFGKAPPVDCTQCAPLPPPTGSGAAAAVGGGTMPAALQAQVAYEMDADVTLSNNKQEMVGVEFTGNAPRTFAMWAKTDASSERNSYNYFECGPTTGCGTSFSLGRWFGEHGASKEGMNPHTWCGGYNNAVGRSSKTLPVDSSKFYHIAHVWDGKEHHIYWEGELFSKGTDGNGQLKTKGKCYLGATDTRFNYGGEIKGVRVFNSALTAGEIKTVYNAGKAPAVVAPAPCQVEQWKGYDGKRCGDCAALVNVRDNGGTCKEFCAIQSLTCADAWDDVQGEQCSPSAPRLGCDHKFTGTTDGICDCVSAAAPAPAAGAPAAGPTGWTMGKFGENCETTCGAGGVDTSMMQKLIDNRRDYKAVNAAFVAAGIKCRNRNGVIATGGQPWEPSFEGENGVEKCWNRPDGVKKCQTPAEPNCFGPGTNWKYNYGPATGRTFPYNTRALCPCKR